MGSIIGALMYVERGLSVKAWPECDGSGLVRKDTRALKDVRENWVVPPGLVSFLPRFPALKALGPSGAGFFTKSDAGVV
jgi:hypothetical protein